ncbi:MAG: cell wall hydrolase [Bacillus sp. (in: firmicutes)]
MKKLFIFAITITLVISSYTVFPRINAQAASIHTGSTLTLFTNKLGIYKNEAKLMNVRMINKVEKVDAPKNLMKKKELAVKISKKEKQLLARLVHSEAKGEPYVGKVAVAAVVLNRLEHKQFPDTIKAVIFEKNAFEPVRNGSIHEPADNEAHQAVEEALENQDKYDDLLYFYNPETATSDWILTRKVMKKIGNHAFAI